MRLFIAVGLISCSMLGCGDKSSGNGSASAKADPALTQAMELHGKWEQTCKGEGDRKEKNKQAKTVRTRPSRRPTTARSRRSTGTTTAH